MNVRLCGPVTLLLSILDGAAKTAPVERNDIFERAERDQPNVLLPSRDDIYIISHA